NNNSENSSVTKEENKLINFNRNNGIVNNSVENSIRISENGNTSSNKYSSIDNESINSLDIQNSSELESSKIFNYTT
ncbi:hypothetical protein H8356DRAFT_968161, partial [Neocallimastix lanati (nom. inval.)]